MRAAVVCTAEDGSKSLMVQHLPDPSPGPGQVLVRVAVAGVCGSDLHGFLDAASTARRDGLVMGHEISGHVEALGEGVQAPAPGTLVTIDPQVVCGECDACTRGWISICERKRVLGSSLRGFEQGGMCELIAVDASLAHPVPQGVPADLAALVEPLANAWHVVDRADPRPADTVVVLGCGPLGLCMIQCLRARGVTRIVATDLSGMRREIAADMGACAVLDPSSDDVGAEVARLTQGVGADVVIESVGVTATYRQALDIVRKRGKVMFFGAVQDTIELPLLRILHREITLIGCTGANAETAPAIAALAAGTVDLEPVRRRTVSLEEADAALRGLADPGCDIVKLLVAPARTVDFQG